MHARIITIGDEILIGQIVDTNAAYISRRLNAIGLVVEERLSIGDEPRAIVQAIDEALGAAQVVILTGGLGPTRDDRTKRTLADYFGMPLREDAGVLEHVREMVGTRGIDFNELNRGQALVPEGCTVLCNRHGTAPGLWFGRDGRVAISLPGVPYEMEGLMDEEVIPRLRRHFRLQAIVHRTLITSGLPESMLAQRITAWESALPPYIRLAYLPSPAQVRLRLSAYEVDGQEVTRRIDALFHELETQIPEYVIGYEGDTVYTSVHELLTDRGLTLAVAESCTGGTIAARFTAQAGASAYFLCGVVAYSNEVKERLLGVDPQVLAREGAVSRHTVEQMAEGVRRLSGADYAVATTGIAGPAGGTPAVPVGTVWMAVAGPDGVTSEVKVLGTVRSQIVDRAAGTVVGMLRRRLLNATERDGEGRTR